MANEFKLSYTAVDINEKLGKIDNLDLALKTIEELLSLKVDESEAVLRDEIEEEDAINLLIKTNVVTPMTMSDNKIVTDSSGEKIYIL